MIITIVIAFIHNNCGYVKYRLGKQLHPVNQKSDSSVFCHTVYSSYHRNRSCCCRSADQCQ